MMRYNPAVSYREPHPFSRDPGLTQPHRAAEHTGYSSEDALKTILLADDDNRVREVVALTLGSEDFTILQAVDGRHALHLARSERPELLLLDVDMPGMDGFQVCEELKLRPGSHPIKIIMLTAKGTVDNELRAMEAGADGFFSKPFSPIALLDKVYEVLEP